MSSKDICREYGFRHGSRRQKTGEDRAEFIERIKKTGSAVITKCRGDLRVVALVFDVPQQMIEDIVATTPKLAKVLARSRALALAESEGDKAAKQKAVKALRDKGVPIDERDDRVRRHNWPQDETAREAAIREALCVSLVENMGDVAETSSCLNVPIHEINRMLGKYDDVLGAYDEGLAVQARVAESQAFKQVNMGNMQALKMVMTNILPERWSERQQVDVRRVGFAPPDEKEEEATTVLSLVKGDKGNA